ncbi:hypothetical protein MTQ93_11410 [Staphylococcus agnetis]|uniref:hypothetical protein n=1 Tax=Staphylococcus agnetis TaxID=985762 RepID=UPI00208F5D7C|nr:hypothetical protein [Staphylococcus agnetis]MCO4346648.1 hypothetical protein [Staphylococcus agnetis]
MKKILFVLFASLLVLGACGNQDETEKASEKKPSKSTVENKKENKEEKSTEEKQSSTQVKDSPKNNTVYGKLTKKHDDNGVVVIDDTTYTLGEDDKILQAEIDFSDLPLDKNIDKNFLNEHAKDLMAKDAEFVSNESDTEQKYHSKSLGKDYYVTFSLNDEGKATTLIVSSFK